jgi:hypothetical protein
MVVGVTPFLIFILVVSLNFYLIEAFYVGLFGARLKWIVGCFVMGAVGIGRISIEEGSERAVCFGLPLAIATWLAIAKFVGAPLLGASVVALVWFCTHQLTWDCTVIDESQDASGEGLLQTAGLDHDGDGDAAIEADLDFSATTAQADDEAEKPPKSMWEKWGDYRRRPHAHGVWVIYFSLGALPVFGLGQLNVSGAAVNRTYCLQYMVAFVASTLMLLSMTSFLSLRRYLRQRQLTMPPAMARIWLGAGAALIVVLLACCSILPRRNPVIDIGQDLSLAFHSPDDLQASRFAPLRDSAVQDQDGGAPGRQQQQTRGGQAGGSQGKGGQGSQGQGSQGQGNQDQGSQGQGNQGQGNQGQGSQGQGSQGQGSQGQGSQGQGNQGQGSQGQGNQGQGNQGQGSQGQGSQGQGNQGQGSQDQGSQNQGRQGQGNQGQGNQGQGNQGQGNQGQGNQGQGNQGQGNQDQGNQGQGSQGQGNQDQGSQDQGSQGQGQQSENSRGSEGSRFAANMESGSRSPDSSSESAAGERSGGGSSRSFNPLAAVSSVVAGVGVLMKLVYYILIIAIVAYIVWRYWAVVLGAFKDFLNALRNLFAGLFGGRDARTEEESQTATAPGSTPPKFADFENPFLTGKAQQWSPDALVEFSFRAFEAWSRDRGLLRAAEQTPIEFAATVAVRESKIHDSARQLAELYCRVAYGRERLNADATDAMQSLWRVMQA